MMASRPHPAPPPLDALLAVIPSLPRPVLAHLTARLIDRLDDLDGDPDLEPDDPPEDDDSDYCLAGDDGCGPVRHMQDGGLVWGSEHEADDRIVPTYGIDQTAPLNAPPAPFGTYR